MSVFKLKNTYKPFSYPWAMMLANEHEKIHWVEDEVDLSEDMTQWKRNLLTPVEYNHITQTLRLFTQMDVAVGNNYYDFFLPVIQNNEIRCMLGSFAAREGIHQRAYALLNDTLGLPDSEYLAFLEYQEMANKIDYMRTNKTDSVADIAHAVAKSVMNEGVGLFGAFVMLLNYQRFGKMKGMCTVVEWSIRDETMHVDGMARLFEEICKENKHILTDPFKKVVYDMGRDSVVLEDKFIDLVYKEGEIEGLSAEEVKLYIRYLTDRRLLQLGFKPIYEIEKNPLPWLDWIINGADHSNFFEKRVSEYNVAGLGGKDWGWSSYYDWEKRRKEESK